MRCLRPWLVRLGFLGAIASVYAPARAAEMRDANVLLGYCTATIGAYVDVCYGYLDAVADQLLAHDAVAGFEACIPSTVDEPGLRFVLIDFLREHEWAGKLAATEAVARALSERFPCR